MSNKKIFKDLIDKIDSFSPEELINTYEKLIVKQSKISEIGTLNKYLRQYRSNLRNNIISKIKSGGKNERRDK